MLLIKVFLKAHNLSSILERNRPKDLPVAQRYQTDSRVYKRAKDPDSLSPILFHCHGVDSSQTQKLAVHRGLGVPLGFVLK